MIIGKVFEIDTTCGFLVPYHFDSNYKIRTNGIKIKTPFVCLVLEKIETNRYVYSLEKEDYYKILYLNKIYYLGTWWESPGHLVVRQLK